MVWLQHWSYIATTNHIHVDEEMNNIPHKETPPNSQDLQQVEHNDKFPTEIEEVITGKEFHFFFHPFTGMMEK